MKKAKIFVDGELAGLFCQESDHLYSFQYFDDYKGPPVSLTLPRQKEKVVFREFPSFLEGLLPEGAMLEILLRRNKIDRNDLFSQLIAVGKDLVGNITVEEVYE